MTTLYPDGDYTFKERVGETYDERGKVYYPALLRVEMTRYRAWQLMHELMSILRDEDRHTEDGRLAAQITFSGTIERHDDDGNRIAMDGDGSETEAQS